MIPGVRSISKAYVEALINFAPTEAIKRAGIGELQRDGAVALFNMLVRNGVAYLADEVGMGKTYIGLAVMHLLRYQKPDARVLIITPRRNIQEKWVSDLTSFVQQNWRKADHRVKTPHGSAVWPTLMPDRLADWTRDVYTEEPHDSVLRMSSFSLGICAENAKDEIDRFKSVFANLPQNISAEMDVVQSEPTQAKLSETIRKLIAKKAKYDLIIVDEAHNLKYGFRQSEASSIRNETMYHLFNEQRQDSLNIKPWLLLLSATPMENGDPLSLVRQFEVFGRDNDSLLPADNESGTSVTIRMLAETAMQEQKRSLQKRLIVRRVGELRLEDGSRYTRNMYRQEWRAGGVESANQPMKKSSPSERLVNAVIQKNVFELLQSRSSGRFRIGALESFEIYSGAASSLSDVDNADINTDKILPDQRLIADLSESYREKFNREIPHPKLNAVAEMLGRNIRNREKSLVFVRRVATTKDLASRASEAFDKVLLELLRSVVNAKEHPIIDNIESIWQRKRAIREYEDGVDTTDLTEKTTPVGDEISEEDEDDSVSEVVPSLFTWMFRGEHDRLNEFPDIFSGRRLREQLEARNRFSLILEENYVDWVLGRPIDILENLSSRTGLTPDALILEIATFIPDNLGSEKNFRHTFHRIQFGTLSWMLTQQAFQHLHNKLNIFIDEIFELVPSTRQERQCDRELILEMLTVRGIYPVLARCPKDSPVWSVVAKDVLKSTDEVTSFEFRNALRTREQIRHMQMALVRHGAPIVDLYLASLSARKGALQVQGQSSGLNVTEVANLLVNRWAKLSINQESFRSSGAWELLAVHENFDLIKKLNFSSLDVIKEVNRPLDAVFFVGQEPRSDNQGIRSVRRMLNQELSGQSPTVAAKGGQTDERRHRITTHFRMPGMPWVVVATSVYEEGVDLHTFCRTVVHHGISHTASSIEQRTGRVDRIGGLLQREAASFKHSVEFTDDKKIQSLFPYQNDTFEKFQVRHVLTNCNRFLEALHETNSEIFETKEMSVADKQEIPKQITKHLTSPFDVQDSPWLIGELNEPDRASEFSIEEYYREFEKLESALKEQYSNFIDSGGQGLDRHYSVNGNKLRVNPRSQVVGDQMYLEVYLNSKLVSAVECKPSGSGWSDSVMNELKKF